MEQKNKNMEKWKEQQFILKVISILQKGGAIGRTEKDTEVLLEFCNKNQLINQFPPESHETFTQHMSIHTFVEDDILFYQGDKIKHSIIKYIIYFFFYYILIHRCFPIYFYNIDKKQDG